VKALARDMRGFRATQASRRHVGDAEADPERGYPDRGTPSNTSYQALLEYAYAGHGGVVAAPLYVR
jgi:hypothetical protein